MSIFWTLVTKSRHLTLDQKQSLGVFLESCDLVKFARFEPNEDALRQLHEAALRLVDETQFDPITSPGAAASAASAPPPPAPVGSGAAENANRSSETATHKS